jgi:signal transduction histidine kinase
MAGGAAGGGAAAGGRWYPRWTAWLGRWEVLFARGRPLARAGSAAVVLVAMGALVGFTLWGRYGHPLWWLDLVVGAVAWLASPVVLWWPTGGTVLLTVLAVLSPAATPPATVGALQVAQRRRFPVAVAVAAGGVAAHAVQGLWRPNGGIAFGWWLTLVVIAYGALVGWGALAQSRRALLGSLRERARRAEAEQGSRIAEARVLERTRIAREMHDVLAHRLSLVATYAGALEYRPDASPEQLSRAAGVVRAGVHQALDELREVILVLRDEDADRGPGADRGETEPPQRGLADVPRLVDESRRAGMVVELRDQVTDPGALPGTAGRAAYHVIREGLTNARKHAAGLPARVSLDGRPGDRLVVEITNSLEITTSPGITTSLASPGAGPAPVQPAALVPGSGTGLVGLGERVGLAGGGLESGVVGAEFRLRAWLPWPA